MTSAAPESPPIGNLTIVYLGPIAPHWEIHTGFGDPQLLEDFKARAQARLLLLAAARSAVQTQPRAGEPRRRASEHRAGLGSRL